MAMQRLAITLILLAILTPITVFGDTRQDKVFDGINAKELQTIFQNLGLRAQIKTLKSGRNYIVSSLGGRRFNVYFHDCENNTVCEDLRFAVWFKNDTGVTSSIISHWINQWHRTKRWGKAYIDDDGDIGFDMNIPVRGGVTKAYFEYSLNVWEGAISSFIRHMQKAASSQ